MPVTDRRTLGSGEYRLPWLVRVPLSESIAPAGGRWDGLPVIGCARCWPAAGAAGARAALGSQQGATVAMGGSGGSGGPG